MLEGGELCLHGLLSPFNWRGDPDSSLRPPSKKPGWTCWEGDPRETSATGHITPMTRLVLAELHRYSQTQN